MNDDLLNMRRFFRNRFEHYAHSCDHRASAELDGSTITLGELCLLLGEDAEPFPRHYDKHLGRLFGRENLATFQKPISYGAVATSIQRRLSFLAHCPIGACW